MAGLKAKPLQAVAYTTLAYASGAEVPPFPGYSLRSPKVVSGLRVTEEVGL